MGCLGQRKGGFKGKRKSGINDHGVREKDEASREIYKRHGRMEETM